MIRTISSLLCMFGLFAGGIIMLKFASDYNSQIGLLIGGALLTAISTCIIFVGFCSRDGTTCFYKMYNNDKTDCKKVCITYKDKKIAKQTVPRSVLSPATLETEPVVPPISPDTLTINVQQT